MSVDGQISHLKQLVTKQFLENMTRLLKSDKPLESLEEVETMAKEIEHKLKHLEYTVKELVRRMK